MEQKRRNSVNKCATVDFGTPEENGIMVMEKKFYLSPPFLKTAYRIRPKKPSMEWQPRKH